MFGDSQATVKAMKPFNLHGLTYWDVSVDYPNGTTEDARLGPEGVAQGIQVGDTVLVRRVAMMIVAIEQLPPPG